MPTGRPWLLILLSTSLTTQGVRAQTVVDFRAGVAASSNLVSDVIIEPVAIRPAIAPTFGLAIGTRLGSRDVLTLSGDWAHSTVERREAGNTARVVSVTVWHGAVGLRREIVAGFSASGRIGVLKYAPGSRGRDASLFRGDAPAVPTVGLGARVGRRLGSRYAVALDATYDMHRFTTTALRAVGFDGRRTVHRISLGATISRDREYEAK